MMRVINQNRKDKLLTHTGEIRSPIADSIEILPQPYAMLIDQGTDTDNKIFSLKLWNTETQRIEWEEEIQIPKK